MASETAQSPCFFFILRMTAASCFIRGGRKGRDFPILSLIMRFFHIQKIDNHTLRRSPLPLLYPTIPLHICTRDHFTIPIQHDSIPTPHVTRPSHTIPVIILYPTIPALTPTGLRHDTAKHSITALNFYSISYYS